MAYAARCHLWLGPSPAPAGRLPMFLALTLFGVSFSGREVAVIGVAVLIVVVFVAWAVFRRRRV